MRFTNLSSDDAITRELGSRIAAARIQRQLTQAQLAEAAGVSKRSIERLEDGTTAQLSNFIRCLRALDKLDGLERLLPESATSPITLLKNQRTPRSRVRTPKNNRAPESAEPTTPKPRWIWGDEK